MKIAQIGLGKWGKKLAMEFSKQAELALVCATGDYDNQNWLAENIPTSEYTTSVSDIMSNSQISGVVIASPIDTHFNLAMQALSAKKHVFIEKPPTTSSDEFSQLVMKAKRHDLLLFVDHIFSYSSTLRHCQENLDLDAVESIAFSWHKYGSFKENIYWNLLYHDMYILGMFGNLSTISSVEKTDVSDDAIQVEFKIIIANKPIPVSIVIDRRQQHQNKRVTFATQTGNIIWQNGTLVNNQNRANQINEQIEQPLIVMIQDFISKAKIARHSVTANARESVVAIETIINVG